MRAKKAKQISQKADVASAGHGLWWNTLAALTCLAILILPCLPTENMTNAATAHFMGMLPVFMVLGLLALWAWHKGHIQWQHNLFPWLLLAFTAAKLLSGLLGPSISRGIWGTWSHYSDGTVYWFILTVVAFVIVLLRPPVAAIRIFLATICLQWFLLSIPVLNERWFKLLPRSVSTLGNSNTFIAYSALLLPVFTGLCIWLFRKTQSPALNASRKAVLRATLAGVVVSFAFCVYALYTCLPIKLQSLVQNKSSPAKNAVSRTAVPSPNASQPAPASSAGNLKGFLHSESNTERYALWQMGIRSLKNSFPFGAGPGGVRVLFHRISSQYPDWDYTLAPDSFHNELLDILNQNGLIGILVYICWLGWTALYIWRARSRLDPDRKLLLYSLVAGACCYWFFLQTVFTVHIPGLLFVTWLSLAVVIVQPAGEPVSTGAPALWRKRCFLLPAAALLLLVLYNGICFRLAEQSATIGNYAGTRQKDLVTAREELDKAIESFPYEDQYQRLAAVFHFQSAGTYPAASPEFKRELSIALTNAESACRLNPASPPVILTRGVVRFVISQFQPQEYAGSIADFETAIQMSPHDPQTYRWIGVAFHVYPGKVTIPDFERLLSRTPLSRQEAFKAEFF